MNDVAVTFAVLAAVVVLCVSRRLPVLFLLTAGPGRLTSNMSATTGLGCRRAPC